MELAQGNVQWRVVEFVRHLERGGVGGDEQLDNRDYGCVLLDWNLAVPLDGLVERRLKGVVQTLDGGGIVLEQQLDGAKIAAVADGHVQWFFRAGRHGLNASRQSLE